MDVRLITRLRRAAGPLAAVVACVAAVGLVAVPAASAADFTWAGGDGAWSAGASWVGGAPPSGTVGALSFPAAACSATACPGTNDDVAGLTAATMSVRGPRSAKAPWSFGSSVAAPLTLTTGLDVAFSDAGPSSQGAATLGLPIVLGADNTWSVDGANVDGQGTFAVSGDHALALSLTHDAALRIFDGRPIEVGPVTISGGGTLDLEQPQATGPGQPPRPSASLNGANGNPVTINGASLAGGGSPTVGALTASAGKVAVTSGTLATAAASFDAASTLSLQGRGGPAYLGGPTVPDSFSQLTSAGAVNLGGANLSTSTTPGFCTRQPSGTVFTLVSTTGTLNGEFGNAPEGAVIGGNAATGGCSSMGSTPAEELRIAYHRDGPTKTVTATIQRPFELVGGTTGNWSAGSTWVGKAAPVAGQHIGRLSLGTGCGGAGCVNDVTGLTIDELVAPKRPSGPLSGKAITLGAGGLSGIGNFALPMTLAADQKWTVVNDGSDSGLAGLVSTGGLSGAALTIDHFNIGSIELGGANELARFTTVGTNLRLDPGATLNARSGNPVLLRGSGLLADGAALGAVRFETGMMVLGQTTRSSGPLKATSLTFGPASDVSLRMAAGANGAKPGVDYGQIDVSGPVDLGDAALAVTQAKSGGQPCGGGIPTGTVYTIVSAKGPISGTLRHADLDSDTPNATVPTKDGDVIPSTCGRGPSTTFGLEIHYTAHTVTATVRALGAGSATSSTLGSLPLPKKSDGKRAKFTIPADAFPAGTKLTFTLRATKSALAAATKAVGSRTVKTKAGAATKVSVTLSKQARKRLRKKGKLKLTVTITAKLPSGARGSKTRNLTLKRK